MLPPLCVLQAQGAVGCAEDIMKRIADEIVLSEEQLNQVRELAQSAGVSERMAQILYSRGIDTAEKAARFLHPSRKNFLSPFRMRGMRELVDAIDADGNTVRSEQPVEHNGKYVMIVEAVGFPAVYTGFREGTPTDEWIKRVYKMGQNDPENKQIRSEAEIASVKK